jgi:hypoxanthine phosphoribosyltransferase
MSEDAPTPWKGLQTDRMPTFLAYDQVERIVGTMLDDVAGWNPEAVVAIVRGGLVPGTMISCMLALPLFMLDWDRTTQLMAWIGPPPDVKRVLLVDDCCATGQTMASVRTALLGQGYDCATLAVVHDPETTCYVPDFSHPMTDLFRFPWERGEATPAARRLRATGAAADRRTELPFFGLDMDGVLMPAVGQPGATSGKPRPNLPAYNGERVVAVTRRPESDRAMLEAWLAGWGVPTLALECRRSETAEDVMSLSRYKAATATRWGCTHFVESDPEQAIRIAAAAPHLQVVWWSAAETRAWIIGAAVQAEARRG